MNARVVVIGGGFSGTMVAVHLRRDVPESAATVTVVEPRPVLGAGLAYSTRDPACRTNVAASRMSPFEETPLAFDDWLAAGGADPADPDMEGAGGRFPARAVFGRYVASLAAEHDVVHRRTEAVAARREERGFVVGLADGTALAADRLVLAVGHPPAMLPRPLRPLADDPRLVADPWNEQALARVASQANATVTIVGTGLTACDVLASLRRRGHRGPIVAVSRRGLTPRPRTTLPVSSFGTFDDAPSRTALALARRVREAVRSAGALGRPWEDVIAALREQAPTVWRALPISEQRRLLRHLRPFWDVHRYQCAPQIATLLADDLQAGRFTVRAMSLIGAEATTDGITLAGRDTARVRSDFVINCTGPGHSGLFRASPILSDMSAAGLLQPDALGLGIATTASNLACGVDGHPIEGLYVAGPPARSAHGELMGLPQVSRQPRAVARAIASSL